VPHGSGPARVEVNTVQVIGERLVTPSAIVFLLVKLRVKAPGTSSPPDTKSGDELDEKFLSTRGDAEELEGSGAGYAHAPYWPGVRLNH
jgi:translocation protein SEC63